MLRCSVLWCVICWWFVVSWCWVGLELVWVGLSRAVVLAALLVVVVAGCKCFRVWWIMIWGCLGLYRFSLGVGAM